jgi:hypothetical protein
MTFVLYSDINLEGTSWFQMSAFGFPSAFLSDSSREAKYASALDDGTTEFNVVGDQKVC